MATTITSKTSQCITTYLIPEHLPFLDEVGGKEAAAAETGHSGDGSNSSGVLVVMVVKIEVVGR